MEWFLEGDLGAAAELRRELRSYLLRHASPESDVEGAVLAFSELLTNSIEHAKSDVWVSLDWGSPNPVVTVHDLGPGFAISYVAPAPESPRGRGLIIASALSARIRTAAKAAGGNRTTMVLDVERPDADDIDPELSRVGGRLPTMDEADDDGYFPREPFLTALVVEMANTVEIAHGPAVAESAITTVGANVGNQMEESYRAHRDISGDLTSAQLADVYVGLKHAIGGDFYTISTDDDKIVLGNRACPFGEAVRHAPSLCRMTSSVFGGIGARNVGHDVAVHLEERIAVGDPECRVTVWLKPPPDEVAVFVHRYRSRSRE